MDRLVNAVVRGSSAAVVPLLLRSSIARRWPVYQQPLDTLAYTGYLHPPVVSRNHGTTNVQTAGNLVANQSKRLLIIKQIYLSMKSRESNRTKWPKPTSNLFERNFWKSVNLSTRCYEVYTVMSTFSISILIIKITTQRRITKNEFDRSNLRYELVVCAIRAPIILATRSEWHWRSRNVSRGSDDNRATLSPPMSLVFVEWGKRTATRGWLVDVAR